MVGKEEVVITEAEAALYDRQIRLWGLEAQKRLEKMPFWNHLEYFIHRIFIGWEELGFCSLVLVDLVLKLPRISHWLE